MAVVDVGGRGFGVSWAVTSHSITWRRAVKRSSLVALLRCLHRVERHWTGWGSRVQRKDRASSQSVECR